MVWRILVSRERQMKQGRVAQCLAKGIGTHNATVHLGHLPNDDDPFIAIGQMWEVERYVPAAVRNGRPFWLIDNGYYQKSGIYGKGIDGYYEFTYRGLTPILMKDPDYHRFPASTALKPWNYNPDGHVLIALPGTSFGKMFGMNMMQWSADIERRVRSFTKKRIKVRQKWGGPKLSDDLRGASVVVTHSSHVSIDALVEGIPAIVASTNPAAPVCSTNLADIDKPWMPDRTHWWASLMCQQYSLEDMKSGVAYHYMQRVMKQVDG